MNVARSLTVVAALAVTVPAHAGDAVRGAKLFLQCRACHVVGVGEAATVGPNLRGAFGAKAGGRPGYAYSSAMSGSGIMWDATTLDTFLTKPSAAVPGTKMIFAGVATDAARADIIAYLATLK